MPPAPGREVVTCSAAPSKHVTLPGRDPLLIQCASPSRPIKIQVLDINLREAPTLVGSREGTTADQLSIPVANGANKFLRVFRAGVAPFTVPIDVVRAGLAGPLPPRTPGGELFLVFERAPVIPQRFVITGPSNISIQPDADPAFSFGGIADGRYTITPVYAGGRHGTIVEANVVSGQTTDVPLRAESVGAAEITTEGLQCQNTDKIRVWREDERQIVTEQNLYPTDPKTCRWRIDGLPLGWYLVSTVARGGRGSIMTFEVVEQKVTYVQVAEAPVRVTGRIIYKGAPLPNANLLFSIMGERGVSVRTDERGEFIAALAVAGDYSTSLFHPDITSFRRATLTLGDNYIDWDIANTGRIRVTADGFELGVNILVTMKGRGASGTRTLMPGAEVAFTGLSSGTYTITAAQGTLRSKPIEVKLDPLNDTLDVKVSPRDQR